jgi:hypothetical protein
MVLRSATARAMSSPSVCRPQVQPQGRNRRLHHAEALPVQSSAKWEKKMRLLRFVAFKEFSGAFARIVVGVEGAGGLPQFFGFVPSFNLGIKNA